MAALSVCFSISTRRCLVAWMRMCGNVQLGALLSSFFFFPLRVPYRPLTAKDSGTQLLTFHGFSVLRHLETLTILKPTGRLGIRTLFFFFFLVTILFFFFFVANRKKKREKKKGFKCECFFWKGSSVVSEDAVQF